MATRPLTSSEKKDMQSRIKYLREQVDSLVSGINMLQDELDSGVTWTYEMTSFLQMVAEVEKGATHENH